MFDPNEKFDPHNGKFDGPDGYQLMNEMEQDEKRSSKPAKTLGGLSIFLIVLGIIFVFIPGGGFLLGILCFYAAWVLS